MKSAVKEDAKSRLLISVRSRSWAATRHVTAGGFSGTHTQVPSCSQVWTCGFPTFFLLNLTVHPQLKPMLLFLWIFAIHFATKQVGANLHGNFLLQNEFEFTGGGGGGVPSDQPTQFSVLVMILFRAKVSLITPFEHLPRPRGDFACANKLTRKTAPFCLWLIYCPITSASCRAARLHAFVQTEGEAWPERRNACEAMLRIFQKSRRLNLLRGKTVWFQLNKCKQSSSFFSYKKRATQRVCHPGTTSTHPHHLWWNSFG